MFQGGDIISLSQKGGDVMESFAVTCGIDAMARAFDKATETWTDALQIDGACAGK